MFQDLARSARVRRRALAWAVAGAALVGAGTPAAALEAPLTTITAEGTLMHVVTELPGLTDTELDVTTFVTVDDVLLELPPYLSPDGATGEPVEITLEAPRGTSLEDAAEGLRDPETSATRVIEVEASADVPSTPGAQPDVAPALAATTDTFTVLPVYWSSTDGTTSATLRNLANATAAYWSEQSAGAIAMATDVREWARIADPGTCDIAALWSSALAAHGLEGSTSHVAIYFPKRADCGGWAGMASIGGGAIWVNGTPIADVFAHELGHNLGLGHANTAACASGSTDVALAPLTSCRMTEYGDHADVMGIATAAPSGNMNTGFADYLGLAEVRRLAPGETATVDLQPLGATTDGERSIAVPLAIGTVYIDFRPAVGRDTRMPAWAGVQVHLRTMHPQYGYPTTYLLDMAPERAGSFSAPALAPGASWQVPWTSQVITVVGTGTTARVSVTTAPAQPTQMFTDVPVTHLFYNEIRWLAEEGITTGLGDGSFGAYTPITREAMAVFLYRYGQTSGYTPPAEARFTDVPVGRYFYREISWLAEEGITTGLGDGSFGALQQITREAMAAFLFRYADETEYVPPAVARFPDVPVNHRFYREISWLAEQGITNGLGDGSFGSLQPATRQEVAAFLYRLDGVLQSA